METPETGADGQPTGADAPADRFAAAADLTLAQQQWMVETLLTTLARDGVAPRHVETHISHVVLHDGCAYKIKKALANAFLDQSTLARRRAACGEELRLNRRLAPGLYWDVVPITGPLAAPAIDGDGPVLDVAVCMRAFDEAGLWDRLARKGMLGAADIDALAALLARFHGEAAAAEPGGRFGTPPQIRPLLLDSLRDLRAGPADAETHWRLAQLQAWESRRFPTLAPVMARRLAEGRVREGHGDLHLGNVARDAGRCLVFDGIEFNEAFRWIDVMSEIAFLAMDLHAHGLPALAHRFVDAYLQHTGDHDGLRVLGYYLVHRALVRAKVAGLRAQQTAGAAREEAEADLRRHVALALQFATPRPRALLATHGLSGSGKTTLTQGLLETIGAVRVRADVERKRLAGLAPLQSSGSAAGQGLYAPAVDAATYARLREAATAIVEGGWPAILDAAFLRRAERDAARALAAALGVPFLLLHFDAPPDVLRERLRRRAARRSDASEADETILARQERGQEPLGADEWPLVQVVRALPGPAPRADWSAVRVRVGLQDGAPPAAPAPGGRALEATQSAPGAAGPRSAP